MLRMKGFSQEWCDWVRNFVAGDSVAIKVNNETGHYFQTKKGLRQGDPLLPILFNIVPDMLAVMIERAKSAGQFEGVVPDDVGDGVLLPQLRQQILLIP